MGEEPEQERVYLNGNLVTRAEANLSIYDHGFLYGDGAFEGIRIYNRNIFRLEPHLDRLLNSVRALGFSLPLDKAGLQNAVAETVRANKRENGYIRFSVSRGVGLGLDPGHIAPSPTMVISTASLRLYTPEMYETGLSVITASTRVPPAVCIDPQVKSLGRYINNIQAKMEANRVGAGEALMLNMAGNVAEATGDNIFIVKGNVLRTPPCSEGALPGITRAAVMDAATHLGIPCYETVLTLYDVYNADEAFLTGTAAEVIPMVRCDSREIGNGKPGNITARLIADFRERTVTEGLRV